jgi:hypothetical protein
MRVFDFYAMTDYVTVLSMFRVYVYSVPALCYGFDGWILFVIYVAVLDTLFLSGAETRCIMFVRGIGWYGFPWSCVWCLLSAPPQKKKKKRGATKW